MVARYDDETLAAQESVCEVFSAPASGLRRSPFLTALEMTEIVKSYCDHFYEP